MCMNTVNLTSDLIVFFYKITRETTIERWVNYYSFLGDWRVIQLGLRVVCDHKLLTAKTILNIEQYYKYTLTMSLTSFIHGRVSKGKDPFTESSLTINSFSQIQQSSISVQVLPPSLFLSLFEFFW